MLRGLLVDLVPLGERFRKQEHKWRNSEASFWASGGERYVVTQAMLDRRYEEWRESLERRPPLGAAFGVQTKDGLPIGGFYVNWVVPFSRLAMLGASIGESDYWGGGYGTDALLLIADYCFDWLDMRKVWLGTTSLNARVVRQMEKVGFVLEARAREDAYMDGAWYDGLLYGILREAWPGRAAMVEKLGLRAKVRDGKG